MEKRRLIQIGISLGIIIIVVLAVVLAINPLWNQISSLNKELAAKRAQVKAEEQYLSDLKQLEKNYNEAKEQAKLAASALPSETKIAELLVQLENTAAEQGLTIESINPATQQQASASAVKAVPSLQEIPLATVVSGTSFPNVNKYMEGIEKNLRLIDISGIALKYDPAKGVILTLNIKSYFQSEDKKGSSSKKQTSTPTQTIK